MNALRRAARAYPTLLRVGISEVVAYRAEFLVWILTTNMPLVMLSLWLAVVADGPVGRFGRKEYIAYYLGLLVVRLVTSSWVVWQLTMDIRQGAVAVKLLRPLHPLIAYSAEHVAAVPLRVLIVSPVLLVLWSAAGDVLTVRDPVLLGIFLLSLVGAWLLVFLTMVIIGSLAFFIESALGLYSLWLAIHTILSGYLIPLEQFPASIQRVSKLLPFWYTLGFPVELLIGMRNHADALRYLGAQWAYVAGLFALAHLTWRSGMRRLVAYGG